MNLPPFLPWGLTTLFNLPQSMPDSIANAAGIPWRKLKYFGPVYLYPNTTISSIWKLPPNHLNFVGFEFPAKALTHTCTAHPNNFCWLDIPDKSAVILTAKSQSYFGCYMLQFFWKRKYNRRQASKQAKAIHKLSYFVSSTWDIYSLASCLRHFLWVHKIWQIWLYCGSSPRNNGWFGYIGNAIWAVAPLSRHLAAKRQRGGTFCCLYGWTAQCM